MSAEQEASQPRQMEMPASDTMRQAAEDFYRLLYLEHRLGDALGAYAAPNFVEHNPDLPNDPADQVQWFADRTASNPDFYVDESQWTKRFVHKFVVGNYLIVHYFLSIGPQDRGRMFADFWRFEGDKIVEHWDVVQPVPEKTCSGNTMW